jgi:hypothetical protein
MTAQCETEFVCTEQFSFVVFRLRSTEVAIRSRLRSDFDVRQFNRVVVGATMSVFIHHHFTCFDNSLNRVAFGEVESISR